MMDSDEERPTKLVINQPYDESLDVADGEEIASVYTPTPREGYNAGGGHKTKPKHLEDMSDEDSADDSTNSKELSGRANAGANRLTELDRNAGGNAEIKPMTAQRGTRDGSSTLNVANDEEEEDDEEDDDESSEDDDDDNETVEGAYDPQEYEHLVVDQEIKDIFKYITKYTPQNLDLDFKLKPFIPDYIPAVGDIDAFLKVPRPDQKMDNLGLVTLDEPSHLQSDPSVFHHRLQAFSKLKKQRETVVKRIENVHEVKGTKDLDSWLKQMSDLTRSMPSQTVQYNRTMPDIESLMQEWPEEFEAALRHEQLPTADMNCDLETYIDMLCSLLDIPVHDKGGKHNRLQSLHVLFTLYQEFKNSAYFSENNING